MKKSFLILLLLFNHLITLEDGNQIEKTDKSINDSPILFDVENYIQNMNDIGCWDDKNEEQRNDFIVSSDNFKIKKNACVKKIESQIFGRLKTDYNHVNLWKVLNENIYKPLAYNVNQKSNIVQIFNDLFHLSKDRSLISDKDTNINYESFENSILKEFKNIEEGTSDLDNNQSHINDSLISILKNFHIYWNSLRTKNEFLRTRNDTMNLMTNLLNQYKVKQRFVFEVTKSLVKKIKEAYGKFMTAHQSLDHLKSNGNEIISYMILLRYKNFCENIKLKNNNQDDYVKELVFLLDLAQSYFISSQKLGISEKDSLLNFHQNIFLKIKEKFMDFNKTLKSGKDQDSFVNIKHFTATLLLKFKHLNFIIFKYKTLFEIVNINKNEVQVQKQLTVKIYYEILDNYLILPKKCENRPDFKNCVASASEKLIKYLDTKYLLKRSISGFALYEYTSDMLNKILENQKSEKWNNLRDFKKDFFKDVFSSLFDFKKKYFIKDTKDLDKLENRVGKIIQVFKSRGINPELVDQLDIDIYDEFLEIKSVFDDFVPLSGNLSILPKIRELVFKFLDNFQEEYKDKTDDNVLILIKNIKENVIAWENEFPNQDKNKDLNSIVKANANIFLFNSNKKEYQQDQVSLEQLQSPIRLNNSGISSNPSPGDHDHQILKVEAEKDTLKVIPKFNNVNGILADATLISKNAQDEIAKGFEGKAPKQQDIHLDINTKGDIDVNTKKSKKV